MLLRSLRSHIEYFCLKRQGASDAHGHHDTSATASDAVWHVASHGMPACLSIECISRRVPSLKSKIRHPAAAGYTVIQGSAASVCEISAPKRWSRRGYALQCGRELCVGTRACERVWGRSGGGGEALTSDSMLGSTQMHRPAQIQVTPATTARPRMSPNSTQSSVTLTYTTAICASPPRSSRRVADLQQRCC